MAAFFQLSDGLQAAAAGALRGIQDVRIPAVIAFISYWLIMIPLSYLLAFKFGMGVKGLWVGFIVGLSIAAVLLLLRFRSKVRRIEFTEL
jgi:MATE family multidrug resistance protein